MELSDMQARVTELEQQISALPAGSITKKTVNGKEYFYHRWTENKKRWEKYIPADELENFRAQIELRKELEQELKAAGVRYEYVEAGNVEDFQGYKNAVNAVLNSMPVDGVDAVVSSDIGAALCVREAMRRHISIPRDLQIIAYDGTYLTDLAGMKMTAVAQNFDKIAQVAVGNIVRAIAKEGDAKADTTSATGRKPYEPDVLIPVTRKLGDTTR